MVVVSSSSSLLESCRCCNVVEVVVGCDDGGVLELSIVEMVVVNSRLRSASLSLHVTCTFACVCLIFHLSLLSCVEN